jgi:hypothetical protein
MIFGLNEEGGRLSDRSVHRSCLRPIVALNGNAFARAFEEVPDRPGSQFYTAGLFQLFSDCGPSLSLAPASSNLFQVSPKIRFERRRVLFWR